METVVDSLIDLIKTYSGYDETYDELKRGVQKTQLMRILEEEMEKLYCGRKKSVYKTVKIKLRVKYDS